MRRPPDYHKPELLRDRPQSALVGDITKLKGPQTWTYFSLYGILDVYRRYVVGWLVAERESATLADHLIAETPQAGHHPRKAHPTCRPQQRHDLQEGRPALGRRSCRWPPRSYRPPPARRYFRRRCLRRP